MPQSSEKLFTFTFGTSGERCTLTAPIKIPLEQSINEYAQRLICAHNLPCFVEGALKDELGQFVALETKTLQDKNAEEVLERLTSKVNVDDLIDRWSRVFTEEVLCHANPEPVSNEHVFSEVYHALIHSAALETLLNLEHTYAMAMGDLTEQRDKDLNHLEKKQREEMENAVEHLGGLYTDDQINQLAQRHFENTQMIESKWASELTNLQETQKREYRDWVMKVHEDTQATEATPAYVYRVRQMSVKAPMDNAGMENGEWNQPQHREESFTVHMGAQLKTMHNIRLLSGGVLDFCKHKPNMIGGVMYPQPQRLQTAMSLYSNKLSGLVLLVDNRLNSYTGVKRDFAKVCEQSTDFHLPGLEQQFQRIEEAVVQSNDWRARQRSARTDDGDKLSLRSTGSDRVSLKSSNSGSSEKEDRSVKMVPGDFYLTRHSNLSEIHVAFHLVTDESVRSSTSDISSRHPVILGYRNILKACFRYDIHTVTLPLLLVHEMSEEMTIPWCLKRAELIFKCVKGFMMEFATWSGQESRNIQFLVPRSLSDETFAAISNMMPQIFRMSNPVVAKS